MNVTKIRRESRERDREFHRRRDDDRGFVWGLALGLWCAALLVALYFSHQP